MNLKPLIVTVALVACVGSAVAQGFPGGGGGQRRGMMGQMGRGMGGPAQLVGREDVQKELNLTSEQKTKLSDLQDKMRTKQRETMQSMMQGGGRPDPDQMRATFEKMNAETQKELDTILNDDQKKRLRELSIQRAGNGAVMMPDVAKELGLTSEQQDKLKSLQQKLQEANQSLMQKAMSGEIDRSEVGEKMQSNQKVMDEEIAKILTGDQKTKLEAMKGKPFTFAADQQRRRGDGL
jgi:Spy/CpxP family protein refolding chaperone